MKHLLLESAALGLVVAAVAVPLAGAGTSYDGYKSGYPQLHAILSAHVTPVPSRGFDWRDASVGAGGAAGLILLLAVTALLVMRRRTKPAITKMESQRRRRFSIKAIFGLLLAVVATGAFAVASSADNRGSSPRHGDLHVTKECSEYTGLADSFCTITSSNLAAIKPGSRVVYLQAAAATSLDSDVVLVEGPGNYALGHVTLDFTTGLGKVTFSGGAGQFSSFHSKVDVSHLGGNNWAWDGKYRFGDHDD